MPEPLRSEKLTPPQPPIHETAPSVEERTAGLAGATPPKDDFSFLDRPQANGELGRLAHYRVLKELGRGGMGCVLLAEDTKLHRKVALKVMLPQHASNPTARDRFLREARSAARIKHDHVITIFQVDEANGVPFIALEFLEGAPLDRYLKDKGALPLGLAVRIAREMAAGLHAAHTKGLIHRDVKPGNVWLEAPKGRVKLLDFGLARAEQEDTQLTQSGAIVGTPAFMAPEQARCEKIDGRCDLWSLGVVLYRLCTGKQPFAGPTTMSVLTAIAVDTPPPARSVNPTIPEALERIIHRLLEKDPARRYPSAQELLADLTAVAKTLTPAAKPSETAAAPPQNSPTSAPSSPPLPGSEADNTLSSPPLRTEEAAPPRRRLSLLLGLAGGLAALLVLGLVILWPTPQGTVRIESDDPDVQIVFNQNGPTIKGVDKQTIQLRAGEHGFVVQRGDLTFETTRFVLKKGETVTLKVEYLPGKLQVVQDGKVLATRDVPLSPTFTNKLGMEFVLVPKGKFWMGGTGGTVGDREAEISHDFYLGKYEITQEEWEKVTGMNPSHFKAVPGVAAADLKRFPVEMVSWDDCQAFLKLVNEKAKETGWIYRLPTEAEWEYACRGGPSSNKFDYGFDFYFDKPSLQILPHQANFNDILKRTCKVGSFQPNKLGLYDIHGNVWEWCDDERKDDKGISRRVNRSGHWGSDSRGCRAAATYAGEASYRNFNLGLRLARVPVGTPALAPKPPEPKKAEAPPTFRNSLGMEFVRVPKGRFWMGGTGGKVGDREVEISHDFYLGKYEITQEEWEKVTGMNPSAFSRTGQGKEAVKDIADAERRRFPVEQVSWDDCQAFLKLVNEKAKETGWIFRLPTEAEWEYACRGGPSSNKSDYGFDFYLDKPSLQLLPTQANFKHGDTALKRTCKVGSYQPNKLGLYDMHGNVWEWCTDEEIDDKGASQRVYRGGCWFYDSGYCRAAGRFTNVPSDRNSSLGLRLARVPVGSSGK